MQNKEKQGFVPVVHSTMQDIVSRSMEMFNKTTDELEENCKKATSLMHQTRLAICAAEQRAAQLGTAIMSNEHVSNGTTWLSGVVNTASKYAIEMGTNKEDHKPNSRKQK